jgi:hypothetical protein
MEEFALWNTERITEIEIVAGPPELVGYGREFWNASQEQRDVAHRAKVEEYEEWERGHPEFLRMRLIGLAKGGQTDALARLIDNGCEVDAVDEDSNTALSWACAYDHIATVAMLIERGADPNIPNSNGGTCLIGAAYEDCVEICRLLLETGADPTMKNVRNRDALFMATNPARERGITPESRQIADMLRSAIRAAGHTIQKNEERGWETAGPVEFVLYST